MIFYGGSSQKVVDLPVKSAYCTSTIFDAPKRSLTFGYLFGC